MALYNWQRSMELEAITHLIITYCAHNQLQTVIFNRLSPMDLYGYNLQDESSKLKIVPATHAEKKIFPDPADKISSEKCESRHSNLARYKYNILLCNHVILNFFTEG